MSNSRIFSTKFHQGAALLLTLWCISVVAISVVLTARIVDSDVEGESARSRRFEARQLALTGLAHGANPDLKRDSEFFYQRLEDGRELRVRIMSESARLNINMLLQEQNSATLKALFELWGVPDNEARVAIDSLADWVDSGDLRRLNGAEREDLQDQILYSQPMNRKFLSVSEMRRVRGMDRVARYKPDWDSFFSVFSGGPIDIQDATSDVLRAAGLFSSSQADLLVSFRNGRDGLPGTADDNWIKNLKEAAVRTGLSPEQMQILEARFTIGGEPTRVESTATVGGAQYRISSVMNRQKKAILLSWEEQ